MEFLKKIKNKIIGLTVLVILTNFILPSVAKADVNLENDVGGTLLEPIMQLVLFLGDSAMFIMQKTLYHEHELDVNVKTKITYIDAINDENETLGSTIGISTGVAGALRNNTRQSIIVCCCIYNGKRVNKAYRI